MNLQIIFKHKLAISIAVALLVATHVLWNYFNGGVPVHHLLHDPEMPGFSNWWGLVSIPLATWFCIYLTEKRLSRYKDESTKYDNAAAKVIPGFLMALGYSIVIALLWQFDLEMYLPYVILIPVLLSLFLTVHYSEHYLGFILGLMFCFGGVLPIIIGFVLLVMSFATNRIIRGGILLIISKLK